MLIVDDKSISKLRKPIFFIGVSLLVLLEIYNRVNWIYGREYLPNFDFFYYLQELTYRLQTGHGYYLNLSLFFDILVMISKVLLLSPLNTIKLVILGNMIVFSTGVVLLSYNKKYWYLVPAIVYIIWGSDIIFYSSYEFIRQVSSISFVPLGMYLIKAHLRSRIKRKFNIFFILGIIILFFSSIIHIFGQVFIALYLFISAKKNGIRIKFLLLLFFLASIYLNLNKLNLLFRSFSLTLPPFNIFFEDKINGMGFFLNLFIGVLVIFFRLKMKEKSDDSWLIWTLFILLYLPIWKTESGSYLVRFTYTSAFLLVLALAYDLAQSYSKEYKKAIIWAVFLLSLNNIVIKVIHRPPLDEASPNPSLEAITSKKKILNQWLPENALIVAPQGVQYRITFFLHRRAVNYKGYADTNRQFPVYKINDFHPASFECSDTTEIKHDLKYIDCIQLEKDWFIWNNKKNGK